MELRMAVHTRTASGIYVHQPCTNALCWLWRACGRWRWVFCVSCVLCVIPEGTTNNSQLCAKHTTRMRDKCAENSDRDTHHHRSGAQFVCPTHATANVCLEHRIRLCALQDISLLLTIMLYRVKMLWHCGGKRSVCVCVKLLLLLVGSATS